MQVVRAARLLKNLRRVPEIATACCRTADWLRYSTEQLFAHLGKAGHVAVSVVEDEFRTGVALFTRVGP